jgi:hypothetical protein
VLSGCEIPQMSLLVRVAGRPAQQTTGTGVGDPPLHPYDVSLRGLHWWEP